jgi:hypothetical protein
VTHINSWRYSWEKQECYTYIEVLLELCDAYTEIDGGTPGKGNYVMHTQIIDGATPGKGNYVMHTQKLMQVLLNMTRFVAVFYKITFTFS